MGLPVRVPCLVLAGLLLATGAQAQTTVSSPAAGGPVRPETQSEWMQAAWTRMARLKSVPPDIANASGSFEVELSLIVRRDGTVVSSRVRKTSGQPALDDHAVRLVMLASPLPPTPPDMDNVLTMTFPVVYDFGPEVWQRKRDSRRQNFASQR